MVIAIGADGDGVLHWRHYVHHHWSHWIATGTIYCRHWLQWRQWREPQIVMTLLPKIDPLLFEFNSITIYGNIVIFRIDNL